MISVFKIPFSLLNSSLTYVRSWYDKYITILNYSVASKNNIIIRLFLNSLFSQRTFFFFLFLNIKILQKRTRRRELKRNFFSLSARDTNSFRISTSSPGTVFYDNIKSKTFISNERQRRPIQTQFVSARPIRTINIFQPNRFRFGNVCLCKTYNGLIIICVDENEI